MKLLGFPCSADRTIRLSSRESVGGAAGQRVRLSFSGSGVLLTADGTSWMCDPPEPDDLEWLQTVASAGTYVVELLQPGTDVVLRVLTFDGIQHWTEPREIGVDDLIVETAQRTNRSLKRSTDVIDWLTETICLAGPEPMAVVVASSGTHDDKNGAFRLVGAGIAMDVKLLDERLVASRIVRYRPRAERRLLLVRGEIRFSDISRTAPLSYMQQQELRQLAEENNAYLAIWDEYNQLELNAAAAAARDIGWAPYDRVSRRADGSWEFELRTHLRSDALRDRIGSETVGLEAGAKVAFDETVDTGRSSTTKVIIGLGRVTRQGTIVITPSADDGDVALPQSGHVAGAFTLDKVRIDRRNRAREAITDGTTVPVRQLATILGDKPPIPVGRRRLHPPMSARVREVLGGQPTPAQLQAIDMAINSPDVALIQGPPGTGKTRVIAAIQARLAEINRGESALARRVLLTSYQHDAVANLVQAADDGTLPPVKLGRQDGREDQSHLAAWTHDLIKRLERRHATSHSGDILRAQRELADRTDYYLNVNPNVTETVELLGWIERHVDLVDAGIAVDAGRAARRLTYELGAAGARVHQERILALARRLRTTAAGYEDDGADTARAAFTTQSFHDTLDGEQRRNLEAAARGDLSIDEAIKSMAAIRDSVIDRVLDSRARAGFVSRFPEVDAILQRARNEAQRQVDLQVTSVDRVVAGFRDVVERQPAAVHDSIMAHTRALAATCQQSVSGSMRDVQSVPFDTVIVDEAARANPLDLMIPLALASGRAILVGDHRQLPQLLDETIAPKISARHDSVVVRNVLSRSLFERLFTKLQDAERRDGQKRVITLDRQYRMHPVLGTFINQQFYAPYGEHVTNGFSDEARFAHGLTRYSGAACGWLDVPPESGPEVRAGSSFSRPAEATVIVNELKDALEENHDLTFGVVTFYKGQAAAIWREMREAGLADRDETLNSSYPALWSSRGLPRVRIGTVDAFQGREFDVVFLSTTRSRRSGSRQRPQFGFLVLPNRLCVAMSRQRRLLVAVGDSSMYSTDEAREALPALHAFFELTGGEHGLRRRP
ncbi:DEAD/DEAH box helicase [Micromonospora chokoriensis]|uniref:DEAD/DEAH box helicase n=1 Tax=Micromonospora chokoriensis TaxID=356851 RepID=UPI0012FB78D7|nr:AAA domain-containing protein [Micromonospora chokoriensis]